MTSRRTRERLIERLRREGIDDERVLESIRTVPRHLFVEEALASRAYEDTALPIGFGQTISQPYVVALMTQSLLAEGTPHSVLEIGTGCGYQTAVLAGLVERVYSVERVESLLLSSKRRLWGLGYRNVRFKLADGGWGWDACAPFDAIVVTAAPPQVPRPLLEQLTAEGRMVIPVGDQASQELLLVQRTGSGYASTCLQQVNFVPLITGQV